MAVIRDFEYCEAQNNVEVERLSTKICSPIHTFSEVIRISEPTEILVLACVH
jgi:hypothetical protein